MGMMVVGASASFPDVDSSYHQEAIDVTQAVGIFEGDENGNFNPDNGVTRNEMAVVMVKLLGLTTGSSTTPFTDVPSWAAPYVAACYNNGIIAGTSETTFSGDSTVTAAQAGLMVMKALGYFSYTGEFGQDWKVSVAKKAAEIQLYADMETYVDEALTRDKVAQLVLNALESDVVIVKESGGVSVSTGDVSVNVTPDYTYTAVVNTNYDYKNRTIGDLAGQDNAQQLCEKLYGTKLKNASDSDTRDDMGRPATVWTYQGTTITSADTPKAVYSTKVTSKQVYNDLSLTADVENPVVYTNGKDNFSTATGTSIKKSDTSDTYKIGKDGLITEIFVDDETNAVSVVQYNEFLVKTTTSYNSSDEKISVTAKTGNALPTEIKAEDFPIVETLSKDEYLVVTAAYDGSSDWTYQTVAKATKVSDVTISEYKLQSYVIADGTKYKFDTYAAKNDTSAVLGYDQMRTSISGLNVNKYDLYLSTTGYVLGIDGSSSSVDLSDYLYVKDASDANLANMAKVVFMDGTTATIEVSKVAANGGSLKSVAGVYGIADSDATGANPNVGSGALTAGWFYTYTKNSSGTYNLTAAKTANVIVGTGIDSTTKSAPITGANTGVYIATNDSIFIADESKYVGLSSIPSTTGTVAVYVLLDDDSYILAAYTSATGSSSADADDYVYIIEADGQGVSSSGDTYYKYTAVVNGQKTTLTADSSSNNKLGLFKIQKYKDGYAVLETEITATNSDVYVGLTDSTNITYKNGTVTFEGTSYVLESDALVYVVNCKNSNSVSIIDPDSFEQLGGLASGTYQVYGVQTSSSDHDLATLVLIRQK
jgi:hypothetical protein